MILEKREAVDDVCDESKKKSIENRRYDLVSSHASDLSDGLVSVDRIQSRVVELVVCLAS